ncbi:hypothetical protein BJ944DRAFT_109356 [Cunninghamella echinulata]|nr:hypothetical protein BJ944DRAFT_109356 [Cunninghamella echinulata]
MNLSNEIISYIAKFCDPYTSLALGRKPDRTRLFIEGGPGILLNRILERGGDIKLLYQMKTFYFPQVKAPMIKCVQLKNEDLVKKVIRVWNTRYCDSANRLAHKKKFIFGMRYIGPELSNIRDMNLYYTRKGKLDMIDITIEKPFSHIHCATYSLGILDKLWQNENFRKYLDDEQKATYLGSKGMISDVSPSTNVLWLAISDHIDLAKSIYVKERDIREHNYYVPAKLGIWDDTPYPEFCKAVYTKDYIKVNTMLQDGSAHSAVNECYTNEDWGYEHSQGWITVRMNEDGTWKMGDIDGYGSYVWDSDCSSVSIKSNIQDVLSGKVRNAYLIAPEEKETMAIIQHMVENKDKWYVVRKYEFSASTEIENNGNMVLNINGDDTSDLDVAIKYFLPTTSRLTWILYKEGTNSGLHLSDYM